MTRLQKQAKLEKKAQWMERMMWVNCGWCGVWYDWVIRVRR